VTLMRRDGLHSGVERKVVLGGGGGRIKYGIN
jgi:hypothetical protein